MLIYFVVTGTSGESLKMEMAQEGFSAAYVPGVKIIARNSLDSTVVIF